MRRRLPEALWRLAIVLCFPLVARAGEAPPVLIDDPALPEISGCAASHRHPGWLWLHNDSGNAPRLFAVDDRGRVQARVAIDGVAAGDWEDIARYDGADGPMLAIADTGDNFALRRELSVLLLPEPEAGTTHAAPARRIRFRYPDGPRDLEAMAVDAAAGQILLLDKRRPPATLYALALAGPDEQTAQRLATVPDWWPEPPTPVETIGASRYRGAATAMDLSPDGRRLAVLNDTHWQVYARQSGESWARALQRAPRSGRLPRQGLPMRDTIYEALCWDAAGAGLWISGERLPAPLIHVEVP
ncbi:hypothetical protein [Solimonas flava]|uniref:hypothetical protein n=1 Tax=Solimonas flava TaxID=415849 RepID=UPI0012B5D825|nr:hypothetical protein [Solimonas flava]